MRQIVEEQQNTHKKILESIEKDKIHQIDNLRKEMLLQIRAVKVKMLNMNEDQLVGTTKLTVIQNTELVIRRNNDTTQQYAARKECLSF